MNNNASSASYGYPTQDRAGVLPAALKMAFEQKITGYYELISFLMGQRAFDGCPALQFMMQSLAPTGFYPRVWQAKNLGELQDLARLYSDCTGFRLDLSYFLMESLGYGLSLTNEPPQLCGISEAPSENIAAEETIPYGAARWDHHWSEDEKRQRITSLIEITHENEKRSGVCAQHPVCTSVTDHNFAIAAELCRMRPGATGALWYVVYGAEGEILSTGMLGALCLGDISEVPRSEVIQVAPRLVSRIRLYWD